MEKDKNFTVIFEKANNHSTVAATGAWGGISPDRTSYIMNFYVESSGFPSYIQASAKDGMIKAEDLNTGERVQRGDMIREVQVTVVVPLSTAKSIADWINLKLQEYPGAKNDN